MAGTLAIRRLRLVGLTPRDHPARRDLAARLADAARAQLARAITRKLQRRSDGEVLRIRQLTVDVTLGATFGAEAFAEVLAGAITAEVARAARGESRRAESETAVRFDSRAAYLAALLEALAVGQAGERWWLREAAEGLRFLSPAAAIRTALIADSVDGQAALMSLSPPRRSRILATLSPSESERVLDAFAAASSATGGASSAGAEAAIGAIVAAAEALDAAAPTPLALYLRASSAGSAGGPSLAAVARLWVRLAAALDRPYAGDSRAWQDWLAGAAAPTPPEAAALFIPEPARTALAASVARRRARGTPAAPGRALAERGAPTLSRFAGLLLLVPGLDIDAFSERVADWPREHPADTAALIAYACMGLCAGRQRFAAWLHEAIWRELFGLDDRLNSAVIAERLSAIAEPEWETLAPLGLALDSTRNARFLFAPRMLIGGRCAASRGLAALAYAVADRFRRRLNGLREPSAPFLWENLLGAGGVLTPIEGGWQARLNRPPLDVLLSLSRLAEGAVRLPGGEVRVTRAAP